MVSMKTLQKTLAIVLAGILLAGALTLAACSGGSTPLLIDGPAPNFTLKDLNGKSVSLSDYKGKAVFLSFWDTSFDADIKQMHFLQELHEEWSKEGKIVLLTIDVEEDAATIKAYMQKNNYTFPVLLDNNFEVAEKYNVQYIPTSLFIDKYGKLQLNIVGPFKDKAAIMGHIAGHLP
jgi:peroxiredoxin